MFITVSKTTKELVLRWKDDGAPIDISDEVKMPQFEIFKIVDTRCQETMHIGKLYIEMQFIKQIYNNNFERFSTDI